MATFDILIKHLRNNPHTSDELRAKTGLTEIPARICDAKEAGFDIDTMLVQDYSKGYKRRIARYALIHEPKQVSA